VRIGFTGAQGTGKTSLLKRIDKADMGYTTVPSTARLAHAAGYKLNREADPISQLITTVSRVSIEDKIYRATRQIISDRTPIDSLAYTSYQMLRHWKMDEEEMEFYWGVSEELVFEHMLKYDYVFYFPIYFPPKNDGVRDGDADYQKDIDVLIKMFLKKSNTPFATIPKGTTDERFSFLTNVID